MVICVSRPVVVSMRNDSAMAWVEASVPLGPGTGAEAVGTAPEPSGEPVAPGTAGATPVPVTDEAAG